MPRVNIQQCQPQAYTAMHTLENYLSGSTIEADLQELIRVRASTLNGCRFCISLHSRAAKKLGVSDEKLAAISHWQKSALFSQKEQAALAMTDSITHIASEGLAEPLYKKAAEFFSENELAQLIMLVATINAWNRLGVSTADES